MTESQRPSSDEYSAVTKSAPAPPAPAPKSDELREVDVSNGENPDRDLDAQCDPNDDVSDPHLTGQRQGEINVENDPTA